MYKCNINHESFGALLSDVYYVASGRDFPSGFPCLERSQRAPRFLELFCDLSAMSLQEENEDLRQEKMPERIFLKSSKNMMILSCRKDGNMPRAKGHEQW